MIVLAFLVLCVCWSTTWHAIELCIEGYPPLCGAALRFLLATLLLVAIVLVKGLLDRRRAAGAAAAGGALPLASASAAFRLPGGAKQHLALAVSGVVNGLGYACIYLAEQTISGGITAVICASSPLFTLLIARLLGLEAMVPRRLIGMGLGLLGVVVLVSGGVQVGPKHFYAMLLAMAAAAVLWPLYGALLKRYADALPPLVSTSYFLLYTALSLVVLSLLRGEPLPTPALLRAAPWTAHAGLLYLSIVGSLLAWTVYLWLLQRLDLSVLSTLGLIQPVLALVIDRLSGMRPLHSNAYLGAGLVVAGMGLSVLTGARSRGPANGPAKTDDKPQA